MDVSETVKPWWWLSFADTDLPAGSQFLGACVVRGDDLPDAIRTAWARGINPGGEVAAAGPIDQLPPGIPEEYTYVLMTKVQVEEMDRLARANG
jgi:hypothetical protein